MKCAGARELIEAYVDGELDATQKAEVRGHLEGCIGCAETHWRLLEAGTNLRKEAPYYEAPAQLRGRVMGALRSEARLDAVRRGVRWDWLAVAASILLVASLGWNLWMLRSWRPGPDRLASEILSSHVRSLMGDHLLDVISSDQHTVKPWFNGKTDFSPQVKDLAGQGYPLIGGRIEFIGERPVAVLVYRSRKHLINVFTWPEEQESKREEAQKRGYNLIGWSRAGMTYWAVSDLNMAGLREFVGLL